MIQNAKYVTINTNDNTAAYHWRESNRAVSAICIINATLYNNFSCNNCYIFITYNYVAFIQCRTST